MEPSGGLSALEVWSKKERSGLERDVYMLVDDVEIEKPAERSRARRESQEASGPRRGKGVRREEPFSFAHHTRPT